MALFHTVSILVAVAALFAYINIRFIKLPTSIGIMVIGLLFSLAVLIAEPYFPGFADEAIVTVQSIDFTQFLLEIILSFLLFAGAYHLDTKALLKEKGTVILTAVLGTIISTFIVAYAFYLVVNLLPGLEISFIHALLFGALISPTDPIAVLAILQRVGAPKDLEINIAGESLFNDGIAVVIFISVFEVANGKSPSIESFGILFIQEALGGIALGLLLGGVARKLMSTIDNHVVEVLITLAVVISGYSLASALHISGPLAMVAAGLFISSPYEVVEGQRRMLSNKTEEYLHKFWEMVDELLNAFLFMLIGLELLVIPFERRFWVLGLASIVIVLVGRAVALAFPIIFGSIRSYGFRRVLTVLTWGGLKGGISVALALSLNDSMSRDLIVTVTYIIVVFSIIIQGLTIQPLLQKLGLSSHKPKDEAHVDTVEDQSSISSTL